MLKKFLTISLALAMGAMLLSGCGGTPTASEGPAQESSAAEEPAPENAAPAEQGEAAPAEATGDTIKIGGLAPLTGNVSVYGIAASNGAKLYINEINAAGGVLGKQVEFLVEDEKGDATEAVNAYNKLVNDGIVALIGDVTSKPSIAVAQVAADEGLPMIAPTATAAEVTMAGTNVFRACFLDPFQGETMATYASTKLNAKTAAVLYNVGDDYSVGLYEAFEAKCKELGLEIVTVESYSTGDMDFKAQLTNIVAKEPDVLFLPDYYNTVVLIASQAKEVGSKAILLGADGWDGVLTVAEDPAALEGSYFCNHYSTQDESEIVQNFLKNYQAEYGEVPNSFAALGYDAAKILLAAIEKAGSADDKPAVIAALQDTQVDGVTGGITFDAGGDPIKSASIITIKDGAYSLVEKLS